MKKTKITWAQTEKMVDKIVKEIKEDNLHLAKFKSIYGIPRGGLIVAVMLSHRLDLPLTQVIKSSTLVVDDISDSGKTLTELNNKNRGLPFVATLITKTKSEFWPDFTGKLTSEKEWYIFPWENEKSSKKDNTKIWTKKK